MTVRTAETIAEGADFLARGDIVSAERLAGALLARGDDPDALHLLALVRIQQSRLEEAVTLLGRSLVLRPRHAHVLFNLGKVLALMGRQQDALKTLEDAVGIQPRLVEAWYELGELQQSLGYPATAEISFRKVLALDPHHTFAPLSLGVAIKDDGRPAEAEPVLAGGMDKAEDPRLKTAFLYQLAFAQYDQGKRTEALANFTKVRRRDPGRASVDFSRADLLMEMNRPDEAVALLEDVLAREPMNDEAHKAYNNLVYRLGRDDEFLKSYDRAPPATPLQLGKASYLLQARRADEAHALYAVILRREPDNLDAAIGAGLSLNLLGRHGEAMAHLEQGRIRHPGNPGLHHHIAATALQARDAKKAALLAEQSLRLAPGDQYGWALLGSAWRMMGDERDELLTGYDDLIRIFDLEAPEGFSNMTEFNAALNSRLGGLHNTPREPISQSLRGGSQTCGKIFNAGDELVDRLKPRIAEAVTRYIAELKPDSGHPFRGRRRDGFRFTGSWSSRLRDSGHHVNHIHPEGWISSCYYVGVPEAVKDETAKQGWIKFGEPGIETGLGPRRAIQPVPGRLVLFPSFVWHGTIPFRDAAPRTTIAFDAVPAGALGAPAGTPRGG
ncbi:MAG TPA: tetratricopeptide repeat protein [Rhizomicrobium sp.]|jgi:tetratricopeptide (TPR) repeat protein|nr:tetratricopeptide repeat protein [Rhizomicrobium sp.]